MYQGQIQGLLDFGMNPVGNGPNTEKVIAALGKLDWCVIAECFPTETAEFWTVSKENPKTETQALKLFNAAAKVKRGTGVEVAVCPPFIYIGEIAAAFKKLSNKKNFSFGAQDVFWEEKGAFTGGVGPKMLRSLGATYVIVGHSERRKWFKETDAMINKKIKLALADGLNVILCVGEPLAIRKKGITAARAFVKKQLTQDLKNVKRSGALKPKGGRIVVAYEPIWSIGTGRFDEPKDAAEMATFIKKTAKAPVLYGGSVNSGNVADYVQYKDIGGALVGGASLKAGEFKKLIINTSKQ